MQFLRTLFWVVLAMVAAVFSFRNWTQVTVNLTAGMQADAKLPVLLFAAFLIGLVPTFILHRATRWSLRRRLDSAERSLAELRALDAPVAASDRPPITAPLPPTTTTPTIVP